jgi:hypothetical protein
MVSVFFIPESPRYLMANGRDAEAVEFLVKYHGNKDPSSRLVLLEVEEMRENIRQDGIDKTYADCKFLSLFCGSFHSSSLNLILLCCYLLMYQHWLIHR